MIFNLSLNFKYSPLVAAFLVLVFLVSSSYLIFLPQKAHAGLNIFGAVFKGVAKALVWVLQSVIMPIITKIITPLLTTLLDFINAPMRIAATADPTAPPGARIMAVATMGVLELIGLAVVITTLQATPPVDLFFKSIIKDVDKGVSELIVSLIIDMIIAEITNTVIEMINNNGNPQFVQDWSKFSSSLADKIGGALLSQITSGYINLCAPFQPQLRLALAPVPSFKTKVACTLSQISGNITNFSNSFENGSWAHWIQVEQNPQYSLIGSYILTQDELQRRLAEQGKAAQNEAFSGKGYLGVKKCIDLAGQSIDASLVKDMDAEQIKEAGYTCKIVTPGDVIAGFSNKIATGTLDKLSAISAQLFGVDPNSKTVWAKILPFVVAIISSAGNQLIKEGLAEVQKEVSPTDTQVDNSGGAAAITGPALTATEIQVNINAAQAIQSVLPVLVDLLGPVDTTDTTVNLMSAAQGNATVLTNIRTLQNNTFINMNANLIPRDIASPAWPTNDTLKDAVGNPNLACSIPQTLLVSTSYPSNIPPKTVENKIFTPTEIGLANVDKTITTLSTTHALGVMNAQIQTKYAAVLITLSNATAQYNTANDPAINTTINNFIAAANIYLTNLNNTTYKTNYDNTLSALIAKLVTVTQTTSTTLTALQADIQYLIDYGINLQITAINTDITTNTAQYNGLQGRTLDSLVCH